MVEPLGPSTFHIFVALHVACLLFQASHAKYVYIYI